MGVTRARPDIVGLQADLKHVFRMVRRDDPDRVMPEVGLYDFATRIEPFGRAARE